MKKLLLIFIVFAFCLAGYGQKITSLTKAANADTTSLIMVRQGATGNLIKKISKGDFLKNFEFDSAIIIGDDIAFIHGGDTLNPYVPYANRTDGDDLYVKLLPDTVAKTNAFTLSLTEANRLVTATKSTVVIITIPLNSSVAIPIGTTINFVQGGAGKMRFKAASGVVMKSKKDSIATGGIYSWAALYKRGTNNWLLYGDISD